MYASQLPSAFRVRKHAVISPSLGFMRAEGHDAQRPSDGMEQDVYDSPRAPGAVTEISGVQNAVSNECASHDGICQETTNSPRSAFRQRTPALMQDLSKQHPSETASEFECSIKLS